MDVKRKIREIVMKALEEMNEDAEGNEKLAYAPETALFGTKGEGVDSFSFVTLVSSIEEQILDVFDREVYLVGDEVYEKKYNPFATIGSLEEYIEEVLQEEK